MDKKSLHDLLEAATVPDPPVGAMPQNAVRAGIRLRRRRRARYASVGAASVAVACAAALAVASGIGRRAAALGPASETVYVLSDIQNHGSQNQGIVTPISGATDRPGRPIVVATGSFFGPIVGPNMVVSPDRKTIWATDGLDTMTAISTITHKAEKTITVVHVPNQEIEQVLFNPDGKTVYVLDSLGRVTPISTATDRPGTPIGLGWASGDQMAITPDGRTLYVLKSPRQYAPGLVGHKLARPSQPPVSDVIPINTATGRPGAPIRVSTNAVAIMVTPDGRTMYAIGQSATGSVEVTPIATASNSVGQAVTIGRNIDDTDPAMAPDGQTIYFDVVPDAGLLSTHKGAPNGVLPFSTVTNTPGTMISLGSNVVPQEMVFTPDSGTLYVITRPVLPQAGCPQAGALMPISTVTGTVGSPIRVGCQPSGIAFTQDGSTAYVASSNAPATAEGSLTPMASSTNRPGNPISIVGYPKQVLVAP